MSTPPTKNSQATETKTTNNARPSEIRQEAEEKKPLSLYFKCGEISNLRAVSIFSIKKEYKERK